MLMAVANWKLVGQESRQNFVGRPCCSWQEDKKFLQSCVCPVNQMSTLLCFSPDVWFCSAHGNRILPSFDWSNLVHSDTTSIGKCSTVCVLFYSAGIIKSSALFMMGFWQSFFHFSNSLVRSLCTWDYIAVCPVIAVIPRPFKITGCCASGWVFSSAVFLLLQAWTVKRTNLKFHSQPDQPQLPSLAAACCFCVALVPACKIVA